VPATYVLHLYARPVPANHLRDFHAPTANTHYYPLSALRLPCPAAALPPTGTSSAAPTFSHVHHCRLATTCATGTTPVGPATTFCEPCPRTPPAYLVFTVFHTYTHGLLLFTLAPPTHLHTTPDITCVAFHCAASRPQLAYLAVRIKTDYHPSNAATGGLSQFTAASFAVRLYHGTDTTLHGELHWVYPQPPTLPALDPDLCHTTTATCFSLRRPLPAFCVCHHYLPITGRTVAGTVGCGLVGRAELTYSACAYAHARTAAHMPTFHHTTPLPCPHCPHTLPMTTHTPCPTTPPSPPTTLLFPFHTPHTLPPPHTPPHCVYTHTHTPAPPHTLHTLATHTHHTSTHHTTTHTPRPPAWLETLS